MSKFLICLMFSTYLIRELWTRFEPELIRPFPFSSVELNRQTYIWMGSVYAIQVLLCYIFQSMADGNKLFWHVVFLLAFAEFIEYFLIYNEHWFKVWSVNVNITNLRYVILFPIVIKELWKTSQSR